MHLPASHRRLSFMLITVVGLCGLAGLWRTGTALAGPLTSGPAAKLTVYQGVAVISPQSGQVMELGNVKPAYTSHIDGLDIASATGINLLPGNGGSVTIAPQNTTNEGGEIALLSPNIANFPEWHIDAYGNYARFYITPQNLERLTIGAGGDIHVMGQLCLLDMCISSWSDVVSTSTAQGIATVLENGNLSNRPIILHPSGTPSGPYMGANGLLDASTVALDNPDIYGTHFSAIMAVMDAALAPGSHSALYGENANGYAGYFSGSVDVSTMINRSNILQLPYGTALGIGGLLAPSDNSRFPGVNPVGYLLEVANTDPNGWAARFSGSVLFDEYNSVLPAPMLTVHSTSTSGAAVKAYGSDVNGPALFYEGTSSGDGLFAYAGLASNFSYSYGGYFVGDTVIEGVASGLSIRFSASGQPKTHSGVWVCSTSSTTCLGRYVYTSSTTPTPARAASTLLWYEVPNNYSTASVAEYDASGNKLYELR